MTARTVALETASIGPDSHGMSRSGKRSAVCCRPGADWVRECTANLRQRLCPGLG